MGEQCTALVPGASRTRVPEMSWEQALLPRALGGRGPLTGIVLLLCVFDIGGELGEDVDACRVGFPVFRSQFGVPEMEGTVF